MRLDTITCADVLDYLREIPDNTVDCVVTSPPYYGLRNYEAEGQIGLEETVPEFIGKMVKVFNDVRRVLKPTGTCWLNLGDSYSSIGHKKSSSGYGSTGLAGGIAQEHSPLHHENNGTGKHKDKMLMPARVVIALQDAGWWVRSEIVWAKPNCMPSSAEDRPTDSHEMVYLLTKAEKYWSDFTAIREPAQDWGTRDRSQMRDGTTDPHLKHNGLKGISKQDAMGKRQYTGFNERWDNRDEPLLTRNIRSVWTITPEPSNYKFCGSCGTLFRSYKGKQCPICFKDDAWVNHFAAFPGELAKRCILAGCPSQVCSKCGKPWKRIVQKEFVPQTDVSQQRGMKNAEGLRPMDESNHWVDTPRGTTTIHTLGWQPSCKCNAGVEAGTVLDPFMGSGTTALVARSLGRHYLGCDLNESYVKLAQARLANAYTVPLFDI